MTSLYVIDFKCVLNFREAHRVGLNHLQTSPPTGPESRQHNPQESVAAVEAQATRGVLLENRKLVTKREDLRLQGRTGSKTGGYQSEKGDEKRAHRGSHHDLTNDRNLFVSDRTEFSVATAVREHVARLFFSQSIRLTRADGTDSYSVIAARCGGLPSS